MSIAFDIAAEHAGLVAQLRAAGHTYYGGDQNDSYTGSGRPFFYVSVPDMRRIARVWLAAHRRDADADLLAMTDALFRGEASRRRCSPPCCCKRMRGSGGRSRRPWSTAGWTT